MKLKPCPDCKSKNIVRLRQFFGETIKDYCKNCNRYVREFRQ